MFEPETQRILEEYILPTVHPSSLSQGMLIMDLVNAGAPLDILLNFISNREYYDVFRIYSDRMPIRFVFRFLVQFGIQPHYSQLTSNCLY